jgi:hypothetical protein
MVYSRLPLDKFASITAICRSAPIYLKASDMPSASVIHAGIDAFQRHLLARRLRVQHYSPRTEARGPHGGCGAGRVFRFIPLIRFED